VKKVLKIEGIPLTEGHSGLYLEVEDGLVKEGKYFALIPVRGFETLLLGKEAVTAPTITSRICGLCQITHSIASARAVEDASSIDVPPEAELLREVLGLSVRIYNNLLHQIVVSEDIFPEKDRRFAFIRKVQKVRKFAGEVLESIGGEMIHSPNIRVGGISEPVEEWVVDRILRSLEDVRKLLLELLEEFKEGVEELWMREGLSETFGRHSLPYFATDRFYGKTVDYRKITFLYPQEVFEGELRREATGLYPVVDGSPVETGPRARKVLFEGYTPKGGVQELHILRAQETVSALDRIREILERHTFAGELWNRTFPTSDGETVGVGVHEAPRGTNIHTVKIDKRGKIVHYRIVVPTELNFLAISHSLKGAPVEKVELIVRAYDPCIVCAVH
jgi:coenzyme F420 hydrogenase subunit alpha